MLDTLSLALSLALADSSRVAVAYPPPPAAPVVMARADIRAPESLTTCYQGRSGSCWTEE